MKTETFTIDATTYTVRIGRNAQNNWDLIDDSTPADIWFHVDGEASAHLVLTVGNMKEMPDKKVLRRCAYLCKIKSKSKSCPKVGIRYTKIENVEKAEHIGQVFIEESKSKILFV
jgi:predicted ribosome quality control (RQC) complex YloA/Tae2 family protein